MNSKDFSKLVEDRCDKIKKTLASKGKEYSTDDDKLHNFNKAGVRTGQSRERALMGMKLKHEISIDDVIDKLDSGVNPSIEVIDEKIGDIINYFILLEACLVDRLNKEEKQLRPLTPDECYKSTLKDRMKEPPDWGNLVGIKKEQLDIEYDGKADAEKLKNPSSLVEGQYIILSGNIISLNKDVFRNTKDVITKHYKVLDKIGDDIELAIIGTTDTRWVNVKTFLKDYGLWKQDS